MEEYEVCPHCDGTGIILIEYNPDTGEDIREVTYTEYLSLSPNTRSVEQCPTCKGEGWVQTPYRDKYDTY
jgi:Ribonuclease G/E